MHLGFTDESLHIMGCVPWHEHHKWTISGLCLWMERKKKKTSSWYSLLFSACICSCSSTFFFFLFFLNVNFVLICLQVQLIPYHADVLDESILWTQGKDLGDGFRTVRMVNNIRLNVDAFHGDKKSGGVHDGTTIVLWEWNKGDNQRWKISPYCKFL